MIFIVWIFISGRIIESKKPFTVVFCLKASDPKAAKYIQDSLKMLRNEFDKLGFLQKIRILRIGEDIINNNEQALRYRHKFDVGLIIWGEIFSGAKDGKFVSEFKTLYFTYKVPPNLRQANIFQFFKNDVNIALINRDWNIYEINSLQDTEKVSENLSETILFLSGLIYAQYRDFAEDSSAILESLFNLLEKKTKNEKIGITDADKPVQTINMSPRMLRKGRLLTLLLGLYKNLGIDFISNHEYKKGTQYLEKCIKYGDKDIDILSYSAFAYFHLNNIDKAIQYTDQINEIERHNQIYLLNYAFFGIYKRNYSSALFYYKEITKRDRRVDNDVIIRAIAFLDERKNDDPKEIAYEFAIGVLNKFHFQKDIGIRELRQFVKKAKKKEPYKEMVAFVENDILPMKKSKRK